MFNIVFDEICRKMQCEHYIEWDYQEEITSGHTRYLSDIVCVSCQAVGQSYNIDIPADNCPYIEELEQYQLEQEARHKRFLKLQEQEKIWEKLNAVE